MSSAELENTLKEAEEFTWQIRAKEQEQTIMQLEQKCHLLSTALESSQSQWKKMQEKWTTQLQQIQEKFLQQQQQLQQQSTPSHVIAIQELQSKIVSLEQQNSKLQVNLDKAKKELQDANVGSRVQTNTGNNENEKMGILILGLLQQCGEWMQEYQKSQAGSHTTTHTIPNDPLQLVKAIQTCLPSPLSDNKASPQLGTIQEGDSSQLQIMHIQEIRQEHTAISPPTPPSSNSNNTGQSKKTDNFLLQPIEHTVNVDEKQSLQILPVDQQNKETMQDMKQQIESLKQQLQEQKQLAHDRQMQLEYTAEIATAKSVETKESLIRIQSVRQELQRKRESATTLRNLIQDVQSRFHNLHEEKDDLLARNEELEGKLQGTKDGSNENDDKNNNINGIVPTTTATGTEGGSNNDNENQKIDNKIVNPFSNNDNNNDDEIKRLRLELLRKDKELFVLQEELRISQLPEESDYLSSYDEDMEADGNNNNDNRHHHKENGGRGDETYNSSFSGILELTTHHTSHSRNNASVSSLEIDGDETEIEEYTVEDDEEIIIDSEDDDEIILDRIQKSMRSLHDEEILRRKSAPSLQPYYMSTTSFFSTTDESIIDEIIYGDSITASSSKPFMSATSLLSSREEIVVEQEVFDLASDEEEEDDDEDDEEEAVVNTKNNNNDNGVADNQNGDTNTNKEAIMQTANRPMQQTLKEIQSLSRRNLLRCDDNDNNILHPATADNTNTLDKFEKCLVEGIDNGKAEKEPVVIIKWLDRDELPDDLEKACRYLIPIVYQGDDTIDPECMMRRSPLPELYRYLKQHYDFKVDITKEVTQKRMS